MSNLLKRLTNSTIDNTTTNTTKPSTKNTDIPVLEKLSEFYEQRVSPPFFVTKDSIDVSATEVLTPDTPAEDKYTVLIQEGGIGDSICLTPAIKSFKKTYPNKELHILTAHPDVYRENPYVDKLYFNASLENFYKDSIAPLKYCSSAIHGELSRHGAHRRFPGPMSMLWSMILNVPWYGDDIELFLTEEEDDWGRWYINSFEKPVVIIQAFASKNPYPPHESVIVAKDWIPEYWEAIGKELENRGFTTMQIGKYPDETLPYFNVSLVGQLGLRQIFALIRHCFTFISVDSMLGHAGPALGKRGFVLLGRSNPLIVGHDSNFNLFAKDSCPHLFCGRPDSIFSDLVLKNGNFVRWDCKERNCMRALTPKMVLHAFDKFLPQIS